jgi:SHS2 domain-containing protein
MNREARYEPLPHTADLGVRVRGEDLGTLFANAAYGLSDNLVALDGVRAVEARQVAAEGSDLEELLVRWLGELLFLFERDAFVGCEFEVAVDAARSDRPGSARATVRGEKLDASRHRVYSEIKAVTYHGLAVRRDESGWQADLIFDL